MMWMLAGRPFSGSRAWNSSQYDSNLSVPSLLSNIWIRRAPALERSSVFDASDFCCCFRRRKGVEASSPLGSSSLELIRYLCFGDWLGVEDLEDWDFFGESNSEFGSSSILDDLAGLCFHPQFFQRCRFEEPEPLSFKPSNFFCPLGVAEAEDVSDCSPPAPVDSSSIIASFFIISSCVACKCFKSTISKSSTSRWNEERESNKKIVSCVFKCLSCVVFSGLERLKQTLGFTIQHKRANM